MAKTETRPVTGICPNHGVVQTTKEVPRVSFPFVVYGFRRAKAAMAPVVCPQCGAKLSKG